MPAAALTKGSWMLDLTSIKTYYDLATSKDFWLEMNPDFNISNRRKKVQAFKLEPRKLQMVEEQLKEEG